MIQFSGTATRLTASRFDRSVVIKIQPDGTAVAHLMTESVTEREEPAASRDAAETLGRQWLMRETR